MPSDILTKPRSIMAPRPGTWCDPEVLLPKDGIQKFDEIADKQRMAMANLKPRKHRYKSS